MTAVWTAICPVCPTIIHIKMPTKNYVGPPDAFDLVHFELEPANKKLGDNYLFKHKIEYN